MHALVSVVIPTFNSSKYLKEAVESVLSQTYPHLELIVVDDGSTDETREALVPFFSDHRVRYFYQENKGGAAARNLGIREARGEFIAFLDHDDVWLPEKIEKQLALFQNEKVGLVYSGSERFGQPRTELRFRPSTRPLSDYFRRGHIYRNLLSANFIPTSSVVIRRSVLDRTGPFLEQIGPSRLWYCDDYELWLRIAKICEIDFINPNLVRHRIHPNQLSVKQLGSYKQLCLLHRYLLFNKAFPGKIVIARNYLKNVVKRAIGSMVLGQ